MEQQNKQLSSLQERRIPLEDTSFLLVFVGPLRKHQLWKGAKIL